MSAHFQIRPFQAEDLPESLPLWHAVEPNITQGEFRARLDGSQAFVAVDRKDKVVGIARLSRRVTMPKDQYFLWIVVAPDMRRQGVGRQLFQRAVQVARSEGVTNFISRIADDNTSAIAFSESLRFKANRHMVNLVLSLETFDAAPIADRVKELQKQGIRFVTYAELGDTPEHQQRLYQLNRTLSAHIPIAEREDFPGLEAYVASRLRPATHLHEGIFIALDTTLRERDNWIGMSSISIHRSNDYAFNEMTGVLPAYNGRGLAQALKLVATRFAQDQRVSKVRTINDVGNQAMLAVNQKFGYQLQDGFYFLKRSNLDFE